MLFENLLMSINKLVWKENLKCLINLRNDLFGDCFNFYYIFWCYMLVSLEKLRNIVVVKVFVE